MYEVEFTANAESDLDRLGAPIAQRVLTRLRWLAENFDAIRPEALRGDGSTSIQRVHVILGPGIVDKLGRICSIEVFLNIGVSVVVLVL